MEAGVWVFGTLVVLYAVAVAVQATLDGRLDIVAPYRPVAELPEAGVDAWTIRGSSRYGAWAGAVLPGARLTVTRDWIGVRGGTTLRGIGLHLVERADVERVVVVCGLPQIGAGIGVVGRDGASRLVVTGTTRSAAEAELDRLGWPHERRRPRLLRPFA